MPNTCYKYNAGSITIREVIGDDVLADNIDLIGVVGQPINKTVAKSLDDLTKHKLLIMVISVFLHKKFLTKK